eukprot:SM000021S06440  [mRNA]  locus=s21:182991:189805:- [translate_table: standard]
MRELTPPPALAAAGPGAGPAALHAHGAAPRGGTHPQPPDRPAASPRAGCCFYAAPAQAEAAIQAPGPLQVRYADGERERPGAVEHKLFVGSIPRHATEEQLRQVLSLPVCRCCRRKANRLPFHGAPHNDNRCGFIKFKSREAAEAAIAALNGLHILQGSDQPLAVRFANVKRPRAADAQRGGPGFVAAAAATDMPALAESQPRGNGHFAQPENLQQLQGAAEINMDKRKVLSWAREVDRPDEALLGVHSPVGGPHLEHEVGVLPPNDFHFLPLLPPLCQAVSLPAETVVIVRRSCSNGSTVVVVQRQWAGTYLEHAYALSHLGALGWGALRAQQRNLNHLLHIHDVVLALLQVLVNQLMNLALPQQPFHLAQQGQTQPHIGIGQTTCTHVTTQHRQNRQEAHDFAIRPVGLTQSSNMASSSFAMRARSNARCPVMSSSNMMP